jgi:hypothetical protein
MAKLGDFLEKLSSDEEFERKYDKRARETMKQFGLKDEHIELVINGTAKQIRDAVRDEEPGAQIVVFRVKMG